MSSLYFLIPLTVVLLMIAVAAWLWSVRSGQYNDLEKEASRILFDDEHFKTDQADDRPDE